MKTIGPVEKQVAVVVKEVVPVVKKAVPVTKNFAPILKRDAEEYYDMKNIAPIKRNKMLWAASKEICSHTKESSSCKKKW